MTACQPAHAHQRLRDTGNVSASSFHNKQQTKAWEWLQVDGHMRTSAPDVYAVGDVAAFPLKRYGNTTRQVTHE